MKMTTNADPALEIKSALGREVGRRFDAGRLVSAVGDRVPDARAARSEGPLSRVPVPVQWLGVAAAVIAAVTGLRSLYLDLATREAPPTPESQAAAHTSRFPEEDLPSAVQEREARVPPATRKRRPPEPLMRREGDPRRSVREKTSVAGVGTDESAAPGPLVSPSEARATLEEPAPIGGATVAGPRDAEPRPERWEPLQYGIFAPGLTPVSVGGAKLESLTLGGRRLMAELREAPEVHATLVTIVGGHASSSRASQAPARGPDPRTTDRGVANTGAMRSASSAPADSSASPAIYYTRLLVGEGFDAPTQEEHGVLGKGLRVVPLRELEVWGGEEHRAFLRSTFGLRTVVAPTGTLLAPPRQQGAAEASLLVGVGGSFYEVSIRVMRTDVEGEHRIQVRLSRKLPREARQAEGREIDASLLVESGHVVVLGIPDPLLAGEWPPAARPGTNMVFLAVSPRIDAAHSFERLVAAEQAPEPPILIDGAEPRYPEEARELRAAGKVVLKAVVREDGSVDGVQVLEVPDVPGSEYLIAAAATAVREWRYLPARRDGQAVPSYVTITLEFRESEGGRGRP